MVPRGSFTSGLAMTTGLIGIEPGTYGLVFASGGKWVPACRDFLDAGSLSSNRRLYSMPSYSKTARKNTTRFT